jgi:DnaJ-class molecular chaperone
VGFLSLLKYIMNRTTTTVQINICEKCKGTGSLRVANLRECHNEDIDQCPYCFGDGSFITKTTIETFRKTPENVLSLIPRS